MASPQPRKRDYAAEYARRQARARALGFASYYERRTRARPGAEKPPAEVLALRRGHRGYRDLLAGIRDGDIVGIDPGSQRDKLGRWKVVSITVLDLDGREHTYRLRNVTEAKVEALLAKVEAVGAISSPTYPLGKLLAEPEASSEAA